MKNIKYSMGDTIKRLGIDNVIFWGDNEMIIISLKNTSNNEEFSLKLL